MERGLLANIFNVPPLVFRFQYNPELLQERKRYKYQQANSFGRWRFDQTSAGAGVLGTLGGLWEDIKEFGPLLTATKPLEAMEGEPRQYTLEFFLDALERGPGDTDDHFGGSIEPDLAVLRSFMYPAWDIVDVGKWMVNGIFDSSWTPPCWNRPPTCTLILGPLSFDCVMEDLDIKIVEFQEDLSPARAEVSVKLLEQTHSPTPMIDFVKRHVDVIRSYNRAGFGEDLADATPILNLFV
ncbi:MAG: hypothetical protein AAF682_04025 [Planctomycetota bacterium]